MNILGLSILPADGGACLLKDGVPAGGEGKKSALSQVEQGEFPVHDIGQCLDQAQLDITDIDLVAIGDLPRSWGRKIIRRAVLQAPRGGGVFLRESRQWLAQQLWVNRLIFATRGFRGRILYCPRHTALAAGLFFVPSQAEAAYLVLDSGCSGTASSWGTGSSTGLSPAGELGYPHSLELLCRAFSHILPPGAGQAGVQGMARYTGKLLSSCIDLKRDGSFFLNPNFFDFFPELQVNSQRLRALLGIADTEMAFAEDLAADLTASVRAMLEEILHRTLSFLCRRTGLTSVQVRADSIAEWADIEAQALAAGFTHCRIQSAADAAEGAALFAWHAHLGRVHGGRSLPKREAAL